MLFLSLSFLKINRNVSVNGINIKAFRKTQRKIIETERINKSICEIFFIDFNEIESKIKLGNVNQTS